MKTLSLTENLSYKASVVWEVISDISRTDWVPGVDKILLNKDTREFFMEGMGKIKKKLYFVTMKIWFSNTVLLSLRLS